MDGYLYMNTPDKYPLQTYLATLLMETKSTVEMQMSPEQLKRMAQTSEKTIEAAQIFLAALPIMCFYPFLQKYYIKGIVVGSVKGDRKTPRHTKGAMLSFESMAPLLFVCVLQETQPPISSSRPVSSTMVLNAAADSVR